MSLPISPRLPLLIALALAAVGLSTVLQQAGADEKSLAFDDSLAVARHARNIFNRRCFGCHGQNGVARKNIFVLDRNRLISSKVVIPGDANSLLIEMVESNAMPLGGPPLPEEEKVALRRWILDGAPEWDPPADKSRTNPLPGIEIPFLVPGLSELNIIALIQRDLMKADERDRSYLRYFSIAHLYNAGATQEEMESHTVALAKLINSLSWHPEITRPAPIDPSGTLFRIDLRDYNWTAATWDRLLAAYPYGLRARDARVVTFLSGADLPYIRADWFVANASMPPLYHDLLGLPETIGQLERMLGVDTFRNLREEKNVARAGVRNSGVSHNNRVLERHVSPYGAYWKSYDFKSNLGNQNIFDILPGLKTGDSFSGM
ncbi:MAG: hypothetical protein L0229_00270 [Blastocatellia bacterium]|nr:hypothetical protein [Blastocatellia bacterium]